MLINSGRRNRITGEEVRKPDVIVNYNSRMCGYFIMCYNTIYVPTKRFEMVQEIGRIIFRDMCLQFFLHLAETQSR